MISNTANDTIATTSMDLVDAINRSMPFIVKNLPVDNASDSPLIILLVDGRKVKPWVALGTISNPISTPTADPFYHPHKLKMKCYFSVLTSDTCYEGYIYFINANDLSDYHLSIMAIITGDGYNKRVDDFLIHIRRGKTSNKRSSYDDPFQP
jgi:hypothetical protein